VAVEHRDGDPDRPALVVDREVRGEAHAPLVVDHADGQLQSSAAEEGLRDQPRPPCAVLEL
jgi:hypothetical protein